LCSSNVEPNVPAKCSKVAHVSEHAFQFKAQRSNSFRTRWHGNLERVLYSLAVGDRVCKTIVPGDRLRYGYRFFNECTLEQLLSTLVRVEMPKLKMYDTVADNTKSKMSGFNDSGMDRANWHFADANSADLQEPIGQPICLCPVKSIDRSVSRIVVHHKRPEIRMSVEYNAVDFVKLPLVPAGSGRDSCQRRNGCVDRVTESRIVP
jgi:hypothetical protein